MLCRGLASATPSLTHLAEHLLGKQLRGGSSSSSKSQQPHDSVEDASAALSLVKAELERLRGDEGPTPPLPPPAVKVRARVRACGRAVVRAMMQDGSACGPEHSIHHDTNII
jgi:hypothetical protein